MHQGYYNGEAISKDKKRNWVRNQFIQGNTNCKGFSDENGVDIVNSVCKITLLRAGNNARNVWRFRRISCNNLSRLRQVSEKIWEQKEGALVAQIGKLKRIINEVELNSRWSRWNCEVERNEDFCVTVVVVEMLGMGNGIRMVVFITIPALFWIVYTDVFCVMKTRA